MKLPNDLLSEPYQLKIELWDINGEQPVTQFRILEVLAQFEVMVL